MLVPHQCWCPPFGNNARGKKAGNATESWRGYIVPFPTRAEPHRDTTSVYISGTELRRGALQRVGPGEWLGPVAGVLVSGGCSQAASSIYLIKH